MSKEKKKCIILQVTKPKTQQPLGETYKSHLDNYISYPIDAISGYCESNIKDLAIDEIISINLSNIGSRKVSVFARVVKILTSSSFIKVFLSSGFVLQLNILLRSSVLATWPNCLRHLWPEC